MTRLTSSCTFHAQLALTEGSVTNCIDTVGPKNMEGSFNFVSTMAVMANYIYTALFPVPIVLF